MTTPQTPTHETPNDPDHAARGADAICNALHLFRICDRATCRRARACRGHGGSCISRHGRIVPEEVWDWVFEVLNVRDDRLTPEEAKHALEPFEGAYLGWIAGIEAGLAARK